MLSVISLHNTDFVQMLKIISDDYLAVNKILHNYKWVLMGLNDIILQLWTEFHGIEQKKNIFYCFWQTGRFHSTDKTWFQMKWMKTKCKKNPYRIYLVWQTQRGNYAQKCFYSIEHNKRTYKDVPGKRTDQLSINA